MVCMCQILIGVLSGICVTLFLSSKVPVGRETLGRIMNVIGDPVDEAGPIGMQV